MDSSFWFGAIYLNFRYSIVVFVFIWRRDHGLKSHPTAGFYTKLNVWGSLGLNFDYDGGPIIENGGPIFLYMELQ